ncbi:MAG TPA: hypothetical protein ENN43_03095 [bacterium]|nr:hypothetical protein [bacterium]
MKAIALLSGGLDSTLAAKAVLEQGIEVIGVNFTSPFCMCSGRNGGCKSKAREMAEQLKIPLKVLSAAEEFIEAVKKPRFGYGSSMNPCIDCRILKFRAAKKYMEEINASFIVTGEVLGQRPMSQNNRAMYIIEKESGLDGYILRPLSALAVAPSIPEKMGWVDREKFFGITGRSRKEQLKLVEKYSIESHACPAGGCLLTDKNFGIKVKDLIDSGMFDMDAARLFQYGRYFSAGKSLKIAAGRNESENRIIRSLAKDGDLLIEAEKKGPVVLARGKIGAEGVREALKIAAYYTKPDGEEGMRFNCKILPDEEGFYAIKEKITEEELRRFSPEYLKEEAG